jgi:glycosyltransferase involved in cell wall biosynthesis
MVRCGGASLTAKLFAERQNAPAGPFEVALAYGQRDGDEEPLDIDGTVTVFEIPDLLRAVSPLHDTRAYYQLRRLMRRFQPDVVHTHSSKAGILGRAAAWAEKVPVIVHHVHGWSFHEEMPRGQRGLYVGLERVMARRCHALLMVAHTDIEMARRWRIGRPEQWHIVRSGIDLSEFSLSGDEERLHARRKLGVPADALVVGTVAQMRAQKAPEDFVEVARRVAQAEPRAFFVWIGDGPLRPDVEAAVKSAGLSDRFLLTGSRRDVREVSPAFDVFLLTSLWEGLPRTVIEAGVTGIPVVATAVAGTAEAIRHRETGLLAAPGDVNGLADCVLAMLGDPQLRQCVRGNAARLGDEFSVDKAVADLEQIYTDLLARNGSGHTPMARAAQGEDDVPSGAEREQQE